MPSQALTIYNDIIITLLENSGLSTLGILSDATFFEYLEDVMQDFLSRTGVTKKLFNIPGLAFEADYVEPDNAMDVQVVSYGQTYIYRSSGWYLDNFNPEWNSQTDFPERWREDEVPPKTLQVEPMPQWDGYQVAVLPATPGYGVISATSNAIDFNLVAVSGAGYGTINGGLGNVPGGTNSIHLEAVNAGFGTVASMVSSTGNIEMVATALPTSYPQTYYDYLELIPDSAVPGLKYGVLAKIWSMDGEYKDNARARYAKARYTEIISAFAAIMTEVGAEDK